MARLNGMKLILPPQGSSPRAEFEQIFSAYGVAPVTVQAAGVESDDKGGWLPVVRSGHASLLWYRVMSEQALRAGLVVRSLDPPIRRIIAVVHARRRLSPTAQDFLTIAERRSAA
jgi:DNA-binding transcriptional LysR family regulator